MDRVVNDLVYLWMMGLVVGMGLMLLIHAIRTKREAFVYFWAVFIMISGCFFGWYTFSDLKRGYENQIQIIINLRKVK